MTAQSEAGGNQCGGQTDFLLPEGNDPTRGQHAGHRQRDDQLVVDTYAVSAGPQGVEIEKHERDEDCRANRLGESGRHELLGESPSANWVGVGARGSGVSVAWKGPGLRFNRGPE